MTRPLSPGRPWPLGVTQEADGANVAVWAPEATDVFLCVFDGEGGEERIRLPYREAGTWHARVPGIDVGTRYGLRADGPFLPDDAQSFNRNKLLIDPYARAIDGPLSWHPQMSDSTHGEPFRDRRDNAHIVPKGIVTGAADGPDPAANRPRHDAADLVVYDAHLKGLTAAHPLVPEELRGTYEGAAHPEIIRHLTSLGVTAVEFLPLQAFIDDQFLVERGLRNYWGYQPILWHAPEPRYARADADAELRGLVHAMHEAGIEVIVDVVYNHTGEGDHGGTTLSLRGLDNPGYYRTYGSGVYVNDTGTGNTFASENPASLRLILDSLRHWADRYGVDGFRFDLAATVGRGPGGFDPLAPFFQAIGQDPTLSSLRLIAEPWDIGPGGYQLGAFPHPWAEWNDRFRDGVRRAWRGELSGRADLGARLLGSSSLFERAGRPATASVNFVTAHDGFTLADVVSYAGKHNEANLEDGRDGHDENFSDGMGAEGPTDDDAILAARARRARAILATLLVSQGTPMLLAGDEAGNSQGGNNNAYAQDNEIGWIDWPAQDDELLEFVRRMIDVRLTLPVLRQRAFRHGGARADGRPDVFWRRADGAAMAEEDWHAPEFDTIVVEQRGAAGDAEGEAMDGTVVLIVALGGDAEVALPESADGWAVEVDSARPETFAGPAGRAAGTYAALAQSVVVLSGP